MNEPLRVVVEVVSSEAVRRLEQRDEDNRQEIKRLEAKINGLHRTIYELMETIANLRSNR